jgi:hypothetical protein
MAGVAIGRTAGSLLLAEREVIVGVVISIFLNFLLDVVYSLCSVMG